jgi:cytochrome c oxidase accessory protein FixG
VQVCPTGIDIRDGLQLECIGCALCIDACNHVMEEMDYPKHLISYTTENAMAGKETQFLRPRLIGYSLAIVVMVSLFSYNLINRIPLRLDVERERMQLYHETSLGMVQNTYNITVMNMGQIAKDYTITVNGIEGLQYLGKEKITVAPGEVFKLPARLQADPTLLKSPSSKINFIVSSTRDSKVTQTQESRFIGPFRP